MREFALLQHIFTSNSQLPDVVAIPPGDDMGALRLGDCTVLVAVDQVADGVHVDVANTSLEKVGRKAITRNLSDVAAMAARPVGAVAAASLPRDFGEANARALFEAMRVTAASFGCPLFGGDVSMWDAPMLLTVTVLAEPFESHEPILRRGAKAGDGVYVTGRLGGSLITMNADSDTDDPDMAGLMGRRSSFAGYTHHLDFTPRLDTARQLAADPVTRPTAMIDLSDGLLGDLKHICEQSNVAAILERDRLPLAQAARIASQRSGKPDWFHALTDGEDYELLFTAATDTMPPWVDDVQVTRIGTVVKLSEGADPVILHDAHGGVVDWPGGPGNQAGGWEHHA